jgi:hypothetical protein
MPLIRLVSNSRLTLSIKEKNNNNRDREERRERERELPLAPLPTSCERGGFQFGFCGDFKVLN